MSDIITQFETAAQAMDAEEMAVRREANARIVVLERARAHAYRRLDFAKSLDAAARAASAHAEAVGAQAHVLLDRFGWSAFDSPPRAQILEAITPVFTAVASVHHAADPATGTTGPSASETIPEHLARFEGWYRDAFGSEFWALADHFFPDTPLVDF